MVHSMACASYIENQYDMHLMCCRFSNYIPENVIANVTQRNARQQKLFSNLQENFCVVFNMEKWRNTLVSIYSCVKIGFSAVGFVANAQTNSIIWA